jgi:lipopolysaccharide assembly outer membrane protein LptD (OstA)
MSKVAQPLRRWSSRGLLLACWLTPIWVILFCASGSAQESPAPLILDHADSSEIIRPGGETEYHLFGNVRFIQGESRFAGDRAVWFQQRGEVRFIGHVKITQPSRSLSAEDVQYNRGERTVLALGDVIVEDTSESFSLHSQRVHFDRDRKIARADSTPVMYLDFLLDSAAQTVVWADTLYFYQNQKQGVGIGSVIIRKGDWRAEGEYGEIWPDSGRAVLNGAPRAEGLGGTIEGDTLIMYYQGRRVERVRAVGEASGSYRDSTADKTGRNLIRGRVADFFLRNDSLNAIRVVGQAYTDYQPDDSTSGVNQASGDSLWLRFDGGRLATVQIEGGAQGTYRENRPGGGEDTVNYEAATIVFAPDANRIDLETSSQMHYGQIQLDAGRISYWTDSRDLVARPDIPDSAGAEATGRPVLADAEQVVVGDTLTYNIDTRRGRIRGSSTEFEGGYYKGADLRKNTEDIFFVDEGIYTTCDREHPHFRFQSRDMEVIRNDKVIARPVVLYIEDLPVAILPYYVFPIKPGRHSGFLPIRFGNFERGSRFISNVGYYWAASDYWDIEGALDFNEETGILLRSTFNYSKRYTYSGSLSGSYARETRLSSSGRTRSKRWSFQGNHSQTLSETAKISGNANFISDKSYYEDYVFNPDDRRQRTLRSQVNFSKRFAERVSLTVAVDATENLDTEDRTLQLPTARLSFPTWRLLAPDSGKDERWYHKAYLSLSTTMRNYSTRTQRDSVTVDKRHYSTALHTGSLSFPQRLLGNITFSPGISFQEAWYYVFDTPLARDQGVPVNDPGRRLSGSFSVGTNTNLYGFLRPHLFGLSAIRHTLTPSVGYSFTPPVKQNDELRAFTGVGGGSSRRTQTMSFSLSHVFDAKIGEGENERKVSLFNARLSSSYNFEAEEHKWSNISGSARTNLASRLDLSMSATWDPYTEAGDLSWWNPRLRNFDVTAGMNLKGTGSPLSAVTELGGEQQGDSLFTSEEIPFNIGLSYRYSESRYSGSITKSHWISTRVDFEPTTNWALSMNNRYDFSTDRVTDQTFEVTRDLHCWRAKFVWRPGGSGQGYYFYIGVKDIPDIKLERSESGFRSGFLR